jgi:cysteine desulfurase
MKTIDLDNAATTPLRPEALQAMLPHMTTVQGNPSSIHDAGALAKRAINAARRTIAGVIKADPSDIRFTSGGTEATNWALKGLFYSNPSKRVILTTKIEHHATLHTCDFLKSQGASIRTIPVDDDGMIDIVALKQMITDDVLAISIILANNEIGTIQDIKSIGRLAKAKGVTLHVDAVQAPGNIALDVSESGIDLLTLSAHKFNGPKGIGILYVKRDTEITPLIHGGAQESRMRAGTENVAGIVGMATALRLAEDERDTKSTRLRHLSTELLEMVRDAYPDVRLNGPEIGPGRLPGHLSLSFPELSGFELAYELNKRGVHVSTGSACSASSMTPSHVLLAINVPDDLINGTIRISMGRLTEEDDIREAFLRLKDSTGS